MMIEACVGSGTRPISPGIASAAEGAAIDGDCLLCLDLSSFR